LPIIDIHTHCAPQQAGDPFGAAEALRGTSAGRNMVTNYRGLPAVAYHEMTDFDLQQEVSARAGITGRLMSNPFPAETMTAISRAPALDIVRHVNDQIAALIDRAPQNLWGLGTLNPLDPTHIGEGERCLGELGFKGLLICSSWHGRFIDTEDAFAFWEWAEARQVPLFIHPPRVPIGHERQMDQYKLDELVGRPFDTAMALARMILSGLLDRHPRLKIVVAHMGGGLLPVMGRLDFGWRLACDGMPERAVIRCERRPSEYLAPPCRHHGILGAACTRGRGGVRRRPRDVRHRLWAGPDRSARACRDRDGACALTGRHGEDPLAECSGVFRARDDGIARAVRHSSMSSRLAFCSSRLGRLR
jgi:predicted TIM-barrel fold metal-dependent hydrolase